MGNALPTAVERPRPRLFLRAAAQEGSVDETARTVRFVASTEAIDGHGTIVKQNWRLDRFKPRGAVLYAHDSDELPVGTATVIVDQGRLMADVTFSTADLNPMAEQVWLNVRAGVLRGISPGFIPHSITYEMHEDRQVVVLDDNELYELSITPCPSNEEAMAMARSFAALTARAAEPGDIPHDPDSAVPVLQTGLRMLSGHPVTVGLGDGPNVPMKNDDSMERAIRAAINKTPPSPSDGPAQTATQPIQEEKTMAETTNTAPVQPTINTVPILRALDLPFGATELDGISRATTLAQLETQIRAITGVQNTAEAIGALRAMKADADRCKAAETELAKVRAERDAQNFEVLIAQGKTDQKLNEPAQEKYWRDLFAKDVSRGADRVDELRGYLANKAPDRRFNRDVRQPETRGAVALTADGKSYKDMSFTARAALKRTDPELFRAMKNDFEAAGGS